MIFSFEGGGSGSQYVEHPFGGGFGPVVRQNTE